MKLSNMVRLVGTAVVTELLYLALTLYNAAIPAIEAQVALGQVKDSIASYSFAQAFMSSHTGKPIMIGLYLIALIALWWEPIVAVIRSTKPEDDQP